MVAALEAVVVLGITAPIHTAMTAAMSAAGEAAVTMTAAAVAMTVVAVGDGAAATTAAVTAVVAIVAVVTESLTQGVSGSARCETGKIAVSIGGLSLYRRIRAVFYLNIGASSRGVSMD